MKAALVQRASRPFQQILRLTNNLQHCGRHQVSIFVSDFIYTAVPKGKAHYDNFLVGTVVFDRNEAPVAQVTAHYFAFMDQLRGTIMGPGVRVIMGGFLRVLCRDEHKVAMRKKKGEVYGLLD